MSENKPTAEEVAKAEMAKMQGDVDTDVDQAAFEEKQRKGIRAWVKENLGGEVTGFTREERWRPQWKVTYTKDGEDLKLFVRGDRPITSPDILYNEMQILQALDKNGLRVPKVYGWIDEPRAIAMEFVEADERDLGYVHTAVDNPTSMSDERWLSMLDYMDKLAQMHAIPVDEFTHIKHFRRLETPEDIALRETERYYRTGLKTGAIDVMLEFIQQWLRRNVPQHRTKDYFIAGDAGQFMSVGPKVTAMSDFEIAAIGDSHWDLACFRGRHPNENMGDIPALYRRYAEATGEEVDLPVVCYHTVNFLQLSVIAAKWFMDPDTRGANYIEGLLETANITRRTYEAIAELLGIKLDWDLHLPEPEYDIWEDSGLRKMMADIARLPTSTSFAEWERHLLEGIPKFLLNYSRYKTWFEAETVADINGVTGKDSQDLKSADEAIAEIIAAGDPARDEEIVRIMHRRMLRFSMLIAGTDPDKENPLFFELEPILS